MKLKRILIVSLFLLAILTIGAVSASEDISSDVDSQISMSEDIDSDALADEEIATNTIGESQADDLGKTYEKDGFNVFVADEVGRRYTGEVINVTMPKDTEGAIIVDIASSGPTLRLNHRITDVEKTQQKVGFTLSKMAMTRLDTYNVTVKYLSPDSEDAIVLAGPQEVFVYPGTALEPSQDRKSINVLIHPESCFLYNNTIDPDNVLIDFYINNTIKNFRFEIKFYSQNTGSVVVFDKTNDEIAYITSGDIYDGYCVFMRDLNLNDFSGDSCLCYVNIYAYGDLIWTNEQPVGSAPLLRFTEAQIVDEYDDYGIWIELTPWNWVNNKYLSLKVADPANKSCSVSVNGEAAKEIKLDDCVVMDDYFLIGSDELGLDAGLHNLNVTFNGISLLGTVLLVSDDDNSSGNETVPVKIVAKDLTAYYNNVKYSVTVYGTDGKVAKNANVVFKINGKKVKTVKTNAKGVATFKSSALPKKYKISTTALGKTVTKKLVVKQVLTLKKVTVKRSAKRLVLTATLKEGKKALKGKKITFKFKGKTYRASTNKKGVAKVTVNKAILKKLKAGKKITYTATYIKDTVKRTVVVRR